MFQKIKDKIKELYRYSILEFHESILEDDEDKFTVYTAFLDLEERDYSVLLDEEWKVSESLNLYEKNVILRFV